MIFSNQALVRPFECEYTIINTGVHLSCKVLDIPKRPSWNYKMSKQAVESQESRMFEAYLQEIYKHYKPEELSHFEHNLEVACILITYSLETYPLIINRLGGNCGGC